MKDTLLSSTEKCQDLVQMMKQFYSTDTWTSNHPLTVGTKVFTLITLRSLMENYMEEVELMMDIQSLELS
jgi:hypothetical protein